MLSQNKVKVVKMFKRYFYSLAVPSLLFWGLSLLLLMGVVNFTSLNNNGARGSRKSAQIFETMTQKNIDVLFLQETHSDSVNVVEWAMSFDGLKVLELFYFG